MVLAPEKQDLYRYPRYDDDIAEALRESAQSTMWDDWDLAGLEYDVPHEYAARLGTKHGIFCATGTAGLHAALMSVELLPGDEVIVPGMTFIRSVTPLLHLGLVPVLADIDSETGNITPQAIEEAASSGTRAVVVVHMWGVPADMRGIVEVCRRQGLILIEDFSHAHFSRHSDGVVGSFGDVAFASMQKKKVLSVGEGGLVVTSSSAIYERLQQIVAPGSFANTPYFKEFSGFGVNLRMSPFSKVVAKALLPRVESIVADRAAHVARFDTLIRAIDAPDLIAPPAIPPYAAVVSAYGYKPRVSQQISMQQLEAINARGRWAFGVFNYDHILASPFWRKSRAHYPFALGIRPRTAGPLHGYRDYVRGRVSVTVPTVKQDYWSEGVMAEWRNDLESALRPETGN